MTKTNAKLNILLFLLSLIIGFIIAEVLTILLVPNPGNKTLYGSDYVYEEFGQIFPNYSGTYSSSEFDTVIHTDELGFRTDSEDVVGGDYNILMLGDSFCFGAGVNYIDTFPHILEKRLNSGSDKIYDVFNGGVNGANIITSLAVYNKLRQSKKFDVVVIQFYVNDIGANNVVSGPSSENILRDIKTWVLDSSKFLELIYTRLNQFSFLYEKAMDLGLNGIQYRDLEYEIVLYGHDHDSEIFSATKETMNELLDVIEEDDSEIVIVYIPTFYQVSQDSLDKIITVLELNETEFNFGLPSEILEDISLERNITFIDMTPYFKESDLDLYYKKDIHMNGDGYEVMGNVIYDNIKDLFD